MDGKPAGTVADPSHWYCPRIGLGISAADSGMACVRSTTFLLLRAVLIGLVGRSSAAAVGETVGETVGAAVSVSAATSAHATRPRVLGMGGYLPDQLEPEVSPTGAGDVSRSAQSTEIRQRVSRR